MKTLTEVIEEAMSGADTIHPSVQEALSGVDAILLSIQADGLTRPQMISILSQTDAQTLKKVSEILKQRHKDDYFPFEPSQDDILRNKEKVCGQIVDAVIELEKK